MNVLSIISTKVITYIWYNYMAKVRKSFDLPKKSDCFSIFSRTTINNSGGDHEVNVHFTMLSCVVTTP